MSNAARLPIVAPRVGACVRTMLFHGADLSGCTFELQARLAADTPGAPLIDLGMQAAGLEGISVGAVTHDANNVPSTPIVIRINEATMKDPTRVPYMGELGDPGVIAYALVGWGGALGPDKRVMAWGELIAEATAYGSDNAPAGRQPNFQRAALWTSNGSSTVQWTDGTIVQVSIDGVDLLASYLAQALAASTSAAQNAGLAAAAKAAAVAAGLVAQQDASDANAYLAAFKQAVGGIPAGTQLPLTALSRAAIAALAPATAGPIVLLSEVGRQGFFRWIGGDQSGLVVLDPYQGLCVAPASDASGKSGAWVRSVVLPGLPGAGEFLTTWWGIGPGDPTTDNQQRLQSCLTGTLIPDGSLLRLVGDIPIAHAVGGTRHNLTVEGYGDGSYLHVTAATDNCIQLRGNNLVFRNFKIDASGPATFANGNVALLVGLDTSPIVYSNILIDNVTTTSASPIGILVTASNDNNTLAPLSNVRIVNCRSAALGQCVSVFGCDDVVIDNLLVNQPAYTTANIEMQAVRVLGSTKVRVSRVYGTVAGIVGIRMDIMARGVANNGHLFRYNRDVSFTDCVIFNALQGGFVIGQCYGTLRIERNRMVADTTTKANVVGLSHNGQNSFNLSGRVDRLILRHNRFEGYAVGVGLYDSLGYADMSHNDFVGNQLTGPYASTGGPLPFQIGVQPNAIYNIVGNRCAMNNCPVFARFEGGDGSATASIFRNSATEGAAPAFLAHLPSGANINVQVSSGTFNEGAGSGGMAWATGANYHAHDNVQCPAGSLAAETNVTAS